MDAATRDPFVGFVDVNVDGDKADEMGFMLTFYDCMRPV